MSAGIRCRGSWSRQPAQNGRVKPLTAYSEGTRAHKQESTPRRKGPPPERTCQGSGGSAQTTSCSLNKGSGSFGDPRAWGAGRGGRSGAEKSARGKVSQAFPFPARSLETPPEEPRTKAPGWGRRCVTCQCFPPSPPSTKPGASSPPRTSSILALISHPLFLSLCSPPIPHTRRAHGRAPGSNLLTRSLSHTHSVLTHTHTHSLPDNTHTHSLSHTHNLSYTYNSHTAMHSHLTHTHFTHALTQQSSTLLKSHTTPHTHDSLTHNLTHTKLSYCHTITPHTHAHMCSQLWHTYTHGHTHLIHTTLTWSYTHISHI